TTRLQWLLVHQFAVNRLISVCDADHTFCRIHVMMMVSTAVMPRINPSQARNYFSSCLNRITLSRSI
ncbi:MAG: hypothetical protein AAF387_18535, partial [Pseudomonadota bacterium]